MVNPYKFNIKTNRAAQKVLIVDDNFISDNYEFVNYSDFDVVFYVTKEESLLEKQLVLLNPVTNNAFMFKPFFISLATVNYCDGIYETIEDRGFIEETIRIQNRMVELRFNIIPRNEDFWTPDNINIAIYRLLLTRANELPKLTLNVGSAFGYMLPIRELFFKYKLITPKHFYEFNKNFMDIGYLEKIDMVNIVHLSPDSYISHILYSETCPQCGSVDIVQEDMIHHFRCANISSETSYMKDGRLVCPKCTRELRHIGVDYDRPSGIYACKKCSMQFSQPIMMATCTASGMMFPIEALIPLEIYNTAFTPLGKKMLSISDEYLFSDDIALFDNILSVNDFKTNVDMRVSIAANHSGSNIYVKILMIKGNFTYDDISKIINLIYSDQPAATITYKQSVIYVLLLDNNTFDKSELHKKEKQIINIGVTDFTIDYAEYNNDISPEDFILQI